MTKLYAKKPDNFQSDLEVSTVFMECNNKILLLQRGLDKVSPGVWGIPGGKLEKGETPLKGLLREIEEELQLTPPPEDLKYVKTLFVQHPLLEYHLHLFQWKLGSTPEIILNPEEHLAFLWQPISTFGHVPLLDGQLEAFLAVYDTQK